MVYIYQNCMGMYMMQTQLCCGDTYQIGARYSVDNQSFDISDKRGQLWEGENWFSNPHLSPWSVSYPTEDIYCLQYYPM